MARIRPLRVTTGGGAFTQTKVQLDSTTVPLGATASYIGDLQDVTSYAKVTGIIYSDQDCTLYIEQSADGTNVDYSTSFAVTGGTGLAFSVEAVAKYARMRIVNGSVAQTTLRAYMYGRPI